MTVHKFIFDVDGTLTPSRGTINDEFKEWLLDFSKEYDVYLATGSDAPKTIEQVGEELFNSVARSYNCSGNSVWEKGVNIYNNDWELPERPWKYLESVLMRSQFRPRTGWHFDVRPGLVNFSIVGRKATPEERKKYVEWDTANKERWFISNEFNLNFSKQYNIEAQVAGETGMDIMPIGKGKQQIIKDFDTNNNIYFFGDKTQPGGNDYDISQTVRALDKGHVYSVKSWEDTWEYLKNICIQLKS